MEHKYSGLSLEAKEAYHGAYGKAAFSDEMVKECRELTDSIIALSDYSYPETLPILMFLSDDGAAYDWGYAADCREMHKKLVMNSEIQIIKEDRLCADYPYRAYDCLADETETFIKDYVN